MNREEKLSIIYSVLCANGSEDNRQRINEKTDDQLDYILSSIGKCIYLEACAGSGKTEVLGIKAAYELGCWYSKNSGIAVLTFTNEATKTISNRISSFYNKPVSTNHFIGTFSSFVQGHISQRFGYKIVGIQGKKDKSFKVIEPSINAYNNNWLNNYKLDFPISSKQKVYANQLSYCLSDKKWHIHLNDSQCTLKELYDSTECQNYINSIRKKLANNNLFQFDYLIEQVKKCKKIFYKDGFANFEDMNLIAHQCLSKVDICQYLAKKFPIIFVDECQDLSTIELDILVKLISAGVKVHLIGDLHQAIYSFKDAYPEISQNLISQNSFTTMYLKDNFRSTQGIVDVSRNLSQINYHIKGRNDGVCEANDCLFIEYTTPEESITAFTKLLEQYKISAKNSVILVRSQNLRQQLKRNNVSVLEKNPIINAIQLWKHNTPTTKQRALQLLAWQLQKWIGLHGNSTNYYFSEEICSNAVTWRLLLRDILEDFCSDTILSNFDGIKYSLWYTTNKNKIIKIVNQHLNQIEQNINVTIRTPPGFAQLDIEQVNSDNETNLDIQTIHASKGSTYNAVLVISAPNAQGKTGFWENWLNTHDEANRIAYVASTRPKYLLCWGVKQLNDNQRQRLESLGFKKYNV